MHVGRIFIVCIALSFVQPSIGGEEGGGGTQACVSQFAQATCMGPWFGWNEPTHLNQAGVVAHWIGFLALFGATVGLGYMSWCEKGPGGKSKFYSGYHEETCLSLYVNMFASLSYFGRVVSDMAGQNWENTGPYILGLGNYRYADYALTCPMLIADLLCCLRAPYKVTGALTIHAMLLSGVIANFYYGRNWPKGGKGPAIAWFCFSSYWYIVAFFGLLHIVRVQYTKLAQLAENTDAKKALLPLRIAIVTIFSLWICYPIVWIIGDQGIGFFSFSTVECIHAFCDIVAKSVYGFTLARFKSYYDKKLCQLLDACGMDGEEEFEDVEKRLKSADGVMSESIAYAKARTPKASTRRYDSENDFADDDHQLHSHHAPPSRPHDRHSARRMSEEAAPAPAEQMSDTMAQIENLNRQLADLMRTARPV